MVSERTGTVVAGERVRIRPVAIAHGGMSIPVSRRRWSSSPIPSRRARPRRPAAQVDAKEKEGPVIALPATSTVEDLAKALNMIGASPRDLVAILQAMKAAGALDAELEVL